MQHDEIRGFACGEAATHEGRIIVDVEIAPPLRRACTSNLFELYRADLPMNTDALLQLSIGTRDELTWDVAATFVDPPSSPNDRTSDGGFDVVSYYCHVIGVHVRRTPTGWLARDDR